jgi:nicotinate-nucleotide pyrophosphorylase (carboxylating)
MMPAIRPLNSSDEVTDLIARALAEDVGPGDVTTETLIDPDRRARARIEQKQAGVVFGIEVAETVFRSLDPSLEWSPVRGEGEWLSHPPATVVEIAAQTRALLTGERVALNFLQHLSGIATAAAEAAHELRGTQAKVLDTRKTTPGLRALEKQAVASGGGHNHRMGLYDAILIKDNHIAMSGGVVAATARALQRRPPGCAVEVECSDLGDVEEALNAGAERILLDNMTPAEVAAAVRLVDGRATTEASGGITLQNLKDYGATGVNFVSLGSLTHSAPALDLAMTIEP